MILNIGLDRLEPQYVLNAMKSNGIIFAEGIQLVQSKPEQTMVISVSDFADISKLAEYLGENCIAGYVEDSGIGEMYGPKCAEYGDFDPAKFYLASGRKLANVSADT